MKKPDVFLLCGTAALFCAAMITLFFAYGRVREQSRKIELISVRLSRLESDEAALPDFPVRYIVGIEGGRLSVFEASGGAVLESYPINLAALSSCDREFLMQGIRVYSEAGLVSVISDYTS